MGTALSIFQIIALAIGFLLVYYALKKFVLSKINLNKWIIFGLSVFSLLIPLIYAAATGGKQAPYWLQLTSQGLMIIFFLWFFEAAGIFKRSEAKMLAKSTEKARLKSLEKSRNANYKISSVKPTDKPNPRRAKNNTKK